MSSATVNQLHAISQSGLKNQPESKSFLSTALMWHGSVTPRVLPRVGVTTLYATVMYYVVSHLPRLALPITPFEYSGAVLALILVMRLNAGHDRWWEARKIWGGIVNQSRNLAVVVISYADRRSPLTHRTMKWIAAWPHLMRQSLRHQKTPAELQHLLDPSDLDSVMKSSHMPTYTAFRIGDLLTQLRSSGIPEMAFLRAETERSLLVDNIGACERIRNTGMPLVLAIKTRRFILFFLLLLPVALVDRVGWLTPLITALVSYPLFSLDEIGAELQNPFSPRNLSHLPLDGICRSIAGNVLGLLKS